MTPNAGHAPRKLYRIAGDEFTCPADIAAASRKEKAGTKTLLCLIPAGNRACDCCFASASHAAQPENVLLAFPVCPFVYSVQEINTSVSEARCVVLRGVRIERRVLGVRKAGDEVLCSHTMSAKRPTILQPETLAGPPTALNLPLQPREGSIHSLAIVWQHADTEETQQRIRLVLLIFRLTVLCPKHPLVNTELI
jgi:hypothetical protein